ncbi:MAG TPA: ChrR family anti-sigma-E factor [Alphaproteobacteria bacterium]|nr:ChrR family anti-sigma-E factor [Alphaproteobacteria bacterium]
MSERLDASHHPSDATLLAYAAGQLSEGLSLVVATHLAWCAGCRESVDVAEVAGGVLLSQGSSAECGEALLAKTLQVLERRSAMSAVSEAKPAAGSPAVPELDLPEPLRGYIERLGRRSWGRLGPGIEQITLMRRTANGGTVRLLRVRPGMQLPRHGHGGVELALVLDGAYRDEIGRFARGDLADLDQETTHQPRADEREGCVCLIATEGRLRFDRRLLRLLQPVLGI